MSKTGKVVVGSVVVGTAAVALFLWTQNANAKQEGLKTVEIERGTLVEKALAVGQIVPDQEIQVKSQISGIVSKTFVEVGDRVEQGQPLFTITPDPTPLELAGAEREVELAEVSLTTGRSRISNARRACGAAASSPRTSSTRARRTSTMPASRSSRRRTSSSSSRKASIDRAVGARPSTRSFAPRPPAPCSNGA
jgi:HlyD family secretion protein